MNVYTKTARFDQSARALTEDEMRKVAPSIFATTAHESRSERFRPIPTIEALRALQNEGFSVVGVRQSLTRVEGKADFTKHLVRLRRLDEADKYSVGDTVCEMLLKNANDGTSAYDLMAGLFRIRCLNSMVAQISTLDTVKVRHSGDVAAKVVEGTYRVLGEAQNVLAAPADWGNIQLPVEARKALAVSAHVLRFADAEGDVKAPIEPDQLLRQRRFDDNSTDLWTTFNVVQENIIKGGITGSIIDAQGRRRRQTTRRINGIDQDVRLNKALWVLGQELAKHMKSAA